MIVLLNSNLGVYDVEERVERRRRKECVVACLAERYELGKSVSFHVLKWDYY